MHFVTDGIVEEAMHIAADEIDRRFALDLFPVRLP